MAEPDRPMLDEVHREIAALAADVREMLALRWELARREALADARSLRRLAVKAAIATVMALTGPPLLAVATAWRLDGWLGISGPCWLLIGGLAMPLAGALVGYFAWRRFRRELVALAGTLEELREDLVWLREWNPIPNP
jgi:hypothetical protein